MLKKNIGLDDVLDTPYELKVGEKTYYIQYPPMGLVAMIEAKRTKIVNTDTKYMTMYMEKLSTFNNVDKKEAEKIEKELENLLKEFITEKFDIVAEMVQLIIEGKKPDGNWKVSKDEIMWEWSVDKVLEVIEVYEKMIDVNDFFSKVIKKKEENQKQIGENSSSH